MIRTVTALRRGPGRDYLVFGRMQRPAPIDGIETIRWEYDGKARAVPAVFQAAWQPPDSPAVGGAGSGGFGVVMANWTSDEQTVTITDPRLGAKATLHLAARTLESKAIDISDHGATVSLPPLSSALVAAEKPGSE